MQALFYCFSLFFNFILVSESNMGMADFGQKEKAHDKRGFSSPAVGWRFIFE